MNRKLNNDIQIPILGFGTWKISDLDASDAVKVAIETGYRHIDTAAIYNNENGVGDGIKRSKVNRDDLFVTTKLWLEVATYKDSLKAFEKSCKLLKTDYVDLYLIHWPTKHFTEQWRAMEELYFEGKIKAIGVSNFNQNHLDDLFINAQVLPTVNQIEMHPRLTQKDLLNYNTKKKIQTVSWSPLMRGRIFEIKELNELADKYNKSIAQVVLRWHLQNGVVTIPKSSNNERIKENYQIFDFVLDEKDIIVIDNLNTNERTGADPETFASINFNL